MVLVGCQGIIIGKHTHLVDDESNKLAVSGGTVLGFGLDGVAGVLAIC